MAGRPAEIFGYYVGDDSEEAKNARQAHWCRFSESVCDRVGNYINFPFGVCSAIQDDGSIYAICPHRYEENGTIEQIPLIWENILLHYFGSNDNLISFRNFKLPGYRTIDCVIAHHKSFKLEIDDFIMVEICSLGLTSAPLSGGISDRSIRRLLLQILEKGIVYENWGTKSYWVSQEYVYANLVKRYGLKQDGYAEEHASRFALQELSLAGNTVELRPTRYVSVSVDEVYQAMRNNPGLPKKDRFVAVLNEKLKARLRLQFE